MWRPKGDSIFGPLCVKMGFCVMDKVRHKCLQQILLTGAADGLGLTLARYYRAKGERPWSELPHLAAEFSRDDYSQVDLAQLE